MNDFQCMDISVEWDEEGWIWAYAQNRTESAHLMVHLSDRGNPNSFAGFPSIPMPHLSAASSDTHQVTRLLHAWASGDSAAFDALMPIVYGELRQLAHALMRRERSDLTLSTTGLVHEAYINLAGQGPDLDGRSHFFAIASTAMRRILVDWARRKGAEKRGGGQRPLPLHEGDAVLDVDLHTILAVDQALGQLELLDARLARVVECRYYGGLSIPDTAAALGIAPATVKRDWTTARAWLKAALADEKPG